MPTEFSVGGWSQQLAWCWWQPWLAGKSPCLPANTGSLGLLAPSPVLPQGANRKHQITGHHWLITSRIFLSQLEACGALPRKISCIPIVTPRTASFYDRNLACSSADEVTKCLKTIGAAGASSFTSPMHRTPFYLQNMSSPGLRCIGGQSQHIASWLSETGPDQIWRGAHRRVQEKAQKNMSLSRLVRAVLNRYRRSALLCKTKLAHRVGGGLPSWP